VQLAPDSSDKWAPDPRARDEWALDSPAGPLTLSAAAEHILTAKAADGASPAIPHSGQNFGSPWSATPHAGHAAMAIVYG